MLHRLIFVTILFLFDIISFSFEANDSGFSKSALKKVEKTISQLWPEREVIWEKVLVSEDARRALSFDIKSDQLFRLKDNSSLVGYLYSNDAPGRFDRFDYIVIFNPDLAILTVRVLVYRGDYGGEIGSKRWLKQFTGKKDGRGMEYKKDIQGISGATISALSISSGIKKLSLNIQELRKSGVI